MCPEATCKTFSGRIIQSRSQLTLMLRQPPPCPLNTFSYWIIVLEKRVRHLGPRIGGPSQHDHARTMQEDMPLPLLSRSLCYQGHPVHSKLMIYIFIPACMV